MRLVGECEAAAGPLLCAPVDTIPMTATRVTSAQARQRKSARTFDRASRLHRTSMLVASFPILAHGTDETGVRSPGASTASSRPPRMTSTGHGAATRCTPHVAISLVDLKCRTRPTPRQRAGLRPLQRAMRRHVGAASTHDMRRMIGDSATLTPRARAVQRGCLIAGVMRRRKTNVDLPCSLRVVYNCRQSWYLHERDGDVGARRGA